MESLITAAHTLEYYYSAGALQHNLGSVGSTNIHGETVMRLDLMANQIVMRYLAESKEIVEATSEEHSDEVRLHPNGRYFIYFDPLDGSSNVRHSLPVGFLFGVAKRNLEGVEDYHLRRGEEFIAAGLFLIPTGMFVLALKQSGAWRFIKDNAGIYVRPERITLPEEPASWELSYNAGHRAAFGEPIRDWLDHHQGRHGFRYAGALAIDFYRLLQNGGLFLYPAITAHPDPGQNRPEGKLRLLYEAAVVAFIAQEAGGQAIDEAGEAILAKTPAHRHQRTPLYVGNPTLVGDLAARLAG
jgi:fructose-1,6-bisphosphatase I